MDDHDVGERWITCVSTRTGGGCIATTRPGHLGHCRDEVVLAYERAVLPVPSTTVTLTWCTSDAGTSTDVPSTTPRPGIRQCAATRWPSPPRIAAVSRTSRPCRAFWTTACSCGYAVTF